MENELPKRKPTRLENFNYSMDGAYFITICTQNRARLLSEICALPVGDGAHDVPSNERHPTPQTLLTHIGKIIEKHLLSSQRISGVVIDRYVIMPDHIHAIIFLNSNKYSENQSNGTSRAPSPTNEMLPHIVSTFKRFCHKEIGENIFQRSYMEHIIRNREDYEEHVKYICENPMRWYYRELYEK